MSSVWKRVPTQKGAQLAQPAAPPPMPTVNVHSIVAGNGQHMVVPPRTGGQPHIGFMGRAPQAHPFSPAETFSPFTGGMNMPSPTQLRATTPAAVNSIAGQAAGTYQLAPGGGRSMPATQKAPGSIGR